LITVNIVLISIEMQYNHMAATCLSLVKSEKHVQQQ